MGIRNTVGKGLAGLVLVGGSMGLMGCGSTGPRSYSPYAPDSHNNPAPVVQNSNSENNSLGLSILGGILSGFGAQRGKPGAVFFGRALSEHGAAEASRSDVNVYNNERTQISYNPRQATIFAFDEWVDDGDRIIQSDELKGMKEHFSNGENISFGSFLRGYRGLVLDLNLIRFENKEKEYHSQLGVIARRGLSLKGKSEKIFKEYIEKDVGKFFVGEDDFFMINKVDEGLRPGLYTAALTAPDGYIIASSQFEVN
jgi:hypothetical protein